MLTAKQVADRLRVSLSWVYANKKALGAFQLTPGGVIRFQEQFVTEMVENAVSDAKREVAGDKDDQRSPQAESISNKKRGKKVGGATNRGAVGATDPYGLCD